MTNAQHFHPEEKDGSNKCGSSLRSSFLPLGTNVCSARKNRPAIFFRATAPRLSLSLFRSGKKRGVGWFLKVEEEEQADASIMPGGAKTLPPSFAFLFSNEEGLLAPPPFRSFFSLAEGKASCQKIRTRKEAIVYLELLTSTMQKKAFSKVRG